VGTLENGCTGWCFWASASLYSIYWTPDGVLEVRANFEVSSYGQFAPYPKWFLDWSNCSKDQNLLEQGTEGLFGLYREEYISSFGCGHNLQSQSLRTMITFVKEQQVKHCSILKSPETYFIMFDSVGWPSLGRHRRSRILKAAGTPDDEQSSPWIFSILSIFSTTNRKRLMYWC